MEMTSVKLKTVVIYVKEVVIHVKKEGTICGLNHQYFYNTSTHHVIYEIFYNISTKNRKVYGFYIAIL